MEIKKYYIEYATAVIGNDIPVLPNIWREKIKSAIEEKLVSNPEVFGKPLRRSLKGFRSLRVGDYRVIYLIKRDVVIIVIIKHRSVTYKEIMKRI
ncbi:MAG: type II toxin-antitoxin system RelE/ParE family toxin [Parcubacteria group bacterium]|nr:type II toxin-antitoxin system RelE/ParE family toxin [Parcubacteria group bacterium]